MKNLKNHFGVIFPLLILLFAIEFSLVASRIVKEYEYSMSNDYNIIVLSREKLNDVVVKAKISSFKELIPIDSSVVLDRLKNELSDRNLKELAKNLPFFYSVKLEILPSPDFMEQIQKDFLSIKGVIKVETFAKTHDKIYRILVIFKNISQAFTFLIALLGITLIFKQMKIWLYEHRRRIEVMTNLGAPYWLKSAMLYKISVIDSFIATILVCAIYAYLPSLFSSVAFLVGFTMPEPQIISDALWLFFASIIVSIISVSLVMIKSKAS